MLRLCSVLCVTAAIFCTAIANAAPPAADLIFPDSTKGFVSIRNLKDFGEQWKKTQLGLLMNDPSMKNFEKEVQKKLSERIEKTFGLTFDGISSLPSGEVAFGMIAVPGQIPGYVLTMDITGKRAETDRYLVNLTQKLVTAGATKSAVTYRGQQITSLVFPPSKTPRTLKNSRVDITLEPTERRAYYMFVQDILVASNQLPLLQLIADRIATGQSGGSLATVEAYQMVMRRCYSDMPSGILPIIRWYVDPLDYGESIRTVLRGPVAQNRREKPSIFSILKQQGFDSLQGIGGMISIKSEIQESVYRAFVYTKKPYRLAMQILNFPDNTNFIPPVWMPADLARCTMLNVDPQAMFDNFGGLFDALVMPGEEGVWQDIMMGLEEDPNGPQINLRDELVAHLGNRLFAMSRYAQPITVNSESIVVAVELKAGHEPAIQAGIKKLFATDPEMKGTAHRSYTIWHRVPAVTIPAATVPVTSEDGDQPPLFPNGGVVAANGFLFLSSDAEYLKTILDRLDMPAEAAQSSISGTAEFSEINQIFAATGLTNTPHFYQCFANATETLRPAFEMIRQGQRPQSQTLLGKLLNEFLLPDEASGVLQQRIDGSTLPAFETIKHYFGNVGMYSITEENGYFIKGFTVERKAQ